MLVRYCDQCVSGTEVCVAFTEDVNPRCYDILDKFDPTGCGGLCLPLKGHAEPICSRLGFNAFR